MLIPPGPARNSSLQSIRTRSCTRGTLDFAKPFLGKANDQATKRLSGQSIEQANKQRRQAKTKKKDTQRHIWRLTWQGCGPGPAKDCIFGEWEVLCQITSVSLEMLCCIFSGGQSLSTNVVEFLKPCKILVPFQIIAAFANYLHAVARLTNNA